MQNAPEVKKEYAAIGGQAVIEGVMMRSPHAFVVAVRTPEGKIRLRRDQWYGLANRVPFFKKPFIRGVLVLVETMANGIVSLNYSANIALAEEEKKDAIKKGLDMADYEKKRKAKEKVSWSTYISIGLSFIFGIGLFVFLPHAITAVIEKFFGQVWGLQSFEFHAVDGVIKACIFLLYVMLIGLFPDVRRVFQYHGAEHKSISTFEAGEGMLVENAKKYPTFHPRCGTTFVFFLLFISIILFSIVFAIFPIGKGLPLIAGHGVAIVCKILLTFPIAGIAYEFIKLMGKYGKTRWGQTISYPGRLLQKLTTREPDEQQLEVALASIRAVLLLEEKYNLKDANQRVVALDEIEIDHLTDLSDSNLKLKDFLEL
ncbi:MAG: hypothetical protein A2X86_16465 [Bdellovibrionales bacterium GWA2_49_15]|nr:MAG: hypothetical protein A2X86_16465 [Bdellovibrionales bacterium GWA2_49_15]HAZ13699.1 DUF1385 domain-containing protein [Bdellovibrionales bacterium]